MDNTTELEYRLATAKLLYMALQGLDVDHDTRLKSANYMGKLFVSPWQDATEQSTQAYGERFFDAVRRMGGSTRMLARWEALFDRDYNPRDPEQARCFIAEFFRLLLHQPRDYHHFVCQRRDITEGGVLDFPIVHPIAVEFWAIYITIAGSATLELGNESIELGPNSVAIIAPGCNCRVTRSPGQERWTYDWLSFRSRLDWIELLEWATALTRPIAFQIEEPANFDWLIQQTGRLESTTYLPGTLSERLCNNIIENILLSIRIFAADVVSEGVATNPKVRGAVDFILNHYGEDISLQDIADQVSSSPGRLSTLFREHFGISVIKWRDQIRMQKARELVIHSGDSINSIATRVGYPDALYFSRRFKEHFGVPPSHFRSG